MTALPTTASVSSELFFTKRAGIDVRESGRDRRVMPESAKAPSPREAVFDGTVISVRTSVFRATSAPRAVSWEGWSAVSSKTNAFSCRASANALSPMVRTVAGTVMRSAVVPRSASSAMAVALPGIVMSLAEPV